MEKTYKQPEPETIASAQALASYWKGLADDANRRMVEMEKILGRYLDSHNRWQSSELCKCRECDNARRVLGGQR